MAHRKQDTSLLEIMQGHIPLIHLRTFVCEKFMKGIHFNPSEITGVSYSDTKCSTRIRKEACEKYNG